MNRILLLAALLFSVNIVYAQKKLNIKEQRLDASDTTLFFYDKSTHYLMCFLKNDTILKEGKYAAYYPWYKKSPILRFQIGKDGKYCGKMIHYLELRSTILSSHDYGKCN